MRRHLRDRALEETEEVSLDEQTLWREAFGPRTAAWLVFRHRRQLHKTGAVDFKIKGSIWQRLSKYGEKLYWLSLAFETLMRRPGWSVQRLTHRGQFTFRLRWHNWLKQKEKSSCDVNLAARFLQ